MNRQIFSWMRQPLASAQEKFGIEEATDEKLPTIQKDVQNKRGLRNRKFML